MMAMTNHSDIALSDREEPVLLAWPTQGNAGGFIRFEKAADWRAFVESLGPIRVLKDGTFLVQSERDGWKHLYRYNADGTLKNRVTSGEWEVRAVARIDEQAGWIYVNGTKVATADDWTKKRVPELKALF